MSLYSMKELLDDAKAGKYAVGYYNGVNMEMIRACIRAAEDMRSPIIMGTAEALLKFSDFDWIAPMLLDAARNASVPVAIHLDHAYSFDIIMKALRWGFGSVMFDGSILPVDRNIEICADISRIAHAMCAGVEGELGKVGGLAEGEGVVGENHLTEVDEAAGFIEKTNVDFLAISIGTTHGVYKEAPKLDLGRLAEIRSKVEIPLVLHGGSGLTNEDFHACIAGGIQKINIFTDVVTAASKAICKTAEKLDYIELLKATEDAIYEVVVDKINTFGSRNKA